MNLYRTVTECIITVKNIIFLRLLSVNTSDGRKK